jgi:hypothetical protein
MDLNKQSRICDCWLRIGSCFCEINKIKNEREQINSNGESNKEHNGHAKRNLESDAKSKRPLDWDARDLKVNGRLLGSSKSTEGEYTHRFWEDE